MKKVVFAIQLFCLLAMLPLYMIIELNHATGKLTVTGSPSDITNEAAKNDIQFTLNSAKENSNVVLFMPNGINN